MPKRDVRSDDLVPIDSALDDLDETFLLCRDVHHSWTVEGYRRSTKGGSVERTLVCERCGTERIDEWSLAGARIQSYYHYAEGYQFKGVDRSTEDPRMALRREVLRRAGVGSSSRKRRR